jgi:hypothetical protein
LLISPRGEGQFRMRWHEPQGPDATENDAIKYATPGKLAIVYGTPESVDEDGTIVLRYHYIRILDPAHFSRRTNWTMAAWASHSNRSMPFQAAAEPAVSLT